MAGLRLASAAGAWQPHLLRAVALWVSIAALVGATAPDCGSRDGGAFITFSVRGGINSRSDPVVFSELDAEARESTASEAGLEAEVAVQQPRLRGSASRTASPRVGLGSGAAETYTVTQWVTDGSFINNAILRARGAIRLKEGHSPPMIPIFNKVVLGTDCDKQWSWHVDPADVGGWVELATEVCDASPVYLEDNGKDWTASPGQWCPWGVVDVLSVEDRRGPRTEMHVPKQSLLLSEAVVTNMTFLADTANTSAAELNASVAGFNESVAAPSAQNARP